MSLTFKQFFNLENNYLSKNFYWANEIAKKLPNISLDLPCIEKKSIIYDIKLNKNPIMILLQDGSKLFMTVDQFKRISGKPEIGKTLVVNFQRLQNDNSNLPSTIKSCKVI
jgi:hypothetical protein